VGEAVLSPRRLLLAAACGLALGLPLPAIGAIGAIGGAAPPPPTLPPSSPPPPLPPPAVDKEQVQSEEMAEALVEAQPPGPPVVAIEIRSDAPLERLEDLQEAIEIEVGQPLSDHAVRHTLRNLQATGEAAEIEIYRREDPGGLVAILVFRAATLVSSVDFVGHAALPKADLRDAVPVKAGQPLAEEKVLLGERNLAERLRRQGYFEARVHLAVRTQPELRRAMVVYGVQSGPRATVRTIVFDPGTAPFAPAALAKQLRVRSGQPYSAHVARGDAERLQAYLARNGYGQARVSSPQETYDKESRTVTLTFPLEIGPKIVVEIQGATAKSLQRKGLLPFLGEGGYDEALVLQAVTRLKAYYQKQGNYDVTVEHDEKTEPGTLRLTIKIVPGPEYVLKDVSFRGNQTFSSDKLLELMATSKRSLLQLGSGRLVDDDLEDDLDNVRRFYSLNGFRQPTVGPPEIGRAGRELRLVIPIVEGTRQTVARLGFDGFEGIDVDKVKNGKGFPLREGEGFHPFLLSQAIDVLRAAFAEQGYAEATVSSRESWNDDHTQVAVGFDALAGARRTVDRVIVRGNQRTEPEVIRRTLGLRAKDPVSDSKLLSVERDLYRLGIFSKVDVQLLQGDLGAQDRDILVRVEEGQPRTLIYGLGWDSQDKTRALVGFSHNNIAGKAYSLRADLRYSQPAQRAQLVFRQPYLGRPRITLTSTLFFEAEDRLLDQSFSVKRYGIRSEASKQISRLRVSLGMEYRRVQLKVLPGAASNDIERRDQPYQLTNLIASAFYDRRNDPIAPTRGWSSLAQTQYAFPAFYTDAEFVKLFLQQTQYLDLGHGTVLAASLRWGGIEPLRALPAVPSDPLADFPSRNVFINERFFAGGDTTQRAFAFETLGILGQTLLRDPTTGDLLKLGGDGLALFNLDYRFPIFGALGGAVFFDSGNVWADWRSINARDLRNGAGLGVQYLSPVGPLRAGIAWKLDRKPGESAYELFLNVGNPF
jgi:outer membrane protein insertion porin family